MIIHPRAPILRAATGFPLGEFRVQEVHGVYAGAISAVHDDAQVGTAHGFVGTCCHEKRAHRPLCATPPVAACIRPSLQTGHQHILEIAFLGPLPGRIPMMP